MCFVNKYRIKVAEKRFLNTKSYDLLKQRNCFFFFMDNIRIEENKLFMTLRRRLSILHMLIIGNKKSFYGAHANSGNYTTCTDAQSRTYTRVYIYLFKYLNIIHTFQVSTVRENLMAGAAFLIRWQANELK